MRLSLLAVLSFALLSACSGESTPSAPTEAPPAAGHEHGAQEPGTHEHGDMAGEHGHAAKHGGIQKELDGKHVEGLAMPDGVLFWVTDAEANPVPLDGISGTATIKGPGGVEQVDLMAMGDHLHAMAKLEQGKPATIVVTLTQDGKAQSATFDVESVGMKSHDHTSLHGGQVGMWGDFHVEYVAKDGEYRFWVTDVTRQVVKSALSGTVTVGETTLPLTVDPATGMLSAKAAGAGTLPVMVDVKAGDASFSLAFNPAPTSGQGDGHTEHHHAGGEQPHEGSAHTH